MAVLWGLRPSAPAKAFTTLRVRVRIDQECMFFYIFGSRIKDHGSFEKMIELFNLCERKDEFGYVRKNGEVFEIHEKISNTKIYASENFCVLEKAGAVESVAIKDRNVRFEKPAGVFKDKLSFLFGDKILIIGDRKAKYRILEYGRFPEKPKPALSERETEMEFLKLCQELEKTNIIKNIEKVKEIIAGKETEISPEEKKFNELLLKISEIDL